MTESMINAEIERNIFPLEYINQLKQRQYTENNGIVSFVVGSIESTDKKFNFNGGAIALHVANLIMAENDREEARERNKQLKQQGKTTSEQIALITKKMTAGKLVVEGGSFHLNEDVLKQALKRELELQKKQDDNRKQDEAKYYIDCYKADQALACNDTADMKKWKSSSDIRDYLCPLRHKDDTEMPLRQEGLELRFLQWNNCRRVQSVYEKEVHDIFEEWLSKQNIKKKGSASGRGKHNETDSDKLQPNKN